MVKEEQGELAGRSEESHDWCLLMFVYDDVASVKIGDLKLWCYRKSVFMFDFCEVASEKK